MMKNQVITIKLNESNFNYNYYQLLNGIMGLTDSELEVLSIIKDSYDELNDWGKVSSTENRKEMMMKSKKTSAAFNNILTLLRKKGCITQEKNVFKLVGFLEQVNKNIKTLTFKVE